MKLSSLLTALGLITSSLAASASDWRSRAIYQVLTDRFAREDGSTTATCNTEDRVYCGGSYQGLINHLDYIQGMGFTAIWISPITYQIPDDTAYGYAYHGYWQMDLYRLNENFGTAADLQALAEALHARDMYLMVDIVVNHNAWDGAASSVDYSAFNPFNSASDYHAYCSVDYSNTTSIEQCWLGDSNVELPDLRTEDEGVAGGYQDWIAELVANYSVDGLRLDTAMQVDTAFWSGFRDAAGVFVTGEVEMNAASDVCPYQEYIGSTLNYPMYYALTNAFSSTSGSISSLTSTIDDMKNTCDDTTVLGSFSENHDQARFASLTGDMSLAQNIIAATILSDGIPIIYEGQEQHYNALGGSSDPYNREAVWFSGYNTEAELYLLVKSLNAIRAAAIANDDTYTTYQNWVVYSDTSTVGMRKGSDGVQLVTVLSNLGADGASYTLSLTGHGWDAGTEVRDLLTCESATVGDDLTLPVPMASGAPRIYYAESLACSSVCDC